jgi:hypothetical protein
MLATLRSAASVGVRTLILVIGVVRGAGASSAAITGVVLDRETRQPVAQAHAQLDGRGTEQLTSEDGRFVFGLVEPGTHRLRVWRLDYAGVLISDVVVRPGRATALVVELVATPLPQTGLEVRASTFIPPRDRHGSSRTLTSDEIRRTPGTLEDPFRVVQDLPGAGVSSGLRNDVFPRGGSPDEVLVLVNGFEFPTPSHFATQGTTGGAVSMIPSRLVRDVSFLAGGFAASYGDRLSSVIDVRLREGAREQLENVTDLGLTGASHLVSGPLGGRGSWLASVRQSYYDLLSRFVDLDAVPFTTDGLVLLAHEPTGSDRISFLALAGQDRVHIPTDASRPTATFTWDIHDRGWRALTGADWQHRWGPRATLRVAASEVIARFDEDIRDAFLGDELVYQNCSREETAAFRTWATLRSHSGSEWKLGLALEHERSHHALAQPLGTENPFSLDPTRVNAITLDREDESSTGTAFAQATLPVVPRLDATIGVRAGSFGALGASWLDPRAGLTLRAARGLAVTGSAGRYHQRPSLLDLHAAPENASLLPMCADHAVVGLEWTPVPDARVVIEAYEKRYRHYPASVQYPSWTLASQAERNSAYETLLPLSSVGRGRSRGVELTVDRKLAGRFYGQLAMSFASARYAGSDGVLRAGAFDLPQVGTLLVGWQPRPGWECSARLRAASGRPFTPTLEPQSTQQGRYIFDLSRLNAYRTPAFRQIDLRLEHRGSLAGRDVTTYAEAQNALGRKNVFRFVWDTRDRRLEPLPELEFVPLVGFEVAL